MGDESSTAQVHPQKLSRALMEAAQEKGCQLRIGEVQNITSNNNAVTGRHRFRMTGVGLDNSCWFVLFDLLGVLFERRFTLHKKIGGHGIIRSS